MLVSRHHHLLVLWLKPKDNTYYLRLISGYSNSYYVGKINQYGHKIVYVEKLVYENYKLPLRHRLLRKLISFLEKIERRI